MKFARQKLHTQRFQPLDVLSSTSKGIFDGPALVVAFRGQNGHYFSEVRT